MKTVAMFQFYTFKKLTNLINDSNMYKYPENTSTELFNANFSSSPVLPLTTTANDSYDMGNPYLGGLEGCIASI
jgi:hypothetical protein